MYSRIGHIHSQSSDLNPKRPPRWPRNLPPHDITVFSHQPWGGVTALIEPPDSHQGFGNLNLLVEIQTCETETIQRERWWLRV